MTETSVVRAIDDYVGHSRHYLSFRENDLILILEKHSSGWWTGQTAQGAKGLVPSSLMREIRVEPPREELLRDFFVFQLACGVKFQRPPYVPRLLNGRDTVPECDAAVDKVSAIQFVEGIRFKHIQHAAAWRRLMECVYDVEREVERAEEFNSLCSNGNLSANQEDRGDGCAGRYPIRQILRDLSALNDEIKGRKCMVRTGLSPCVVELLEWGGDCYNEITLYRELLYERLRCYHREARETGVELSALSKRLQEERRNCYKDRERLVRRIRIRDAKIRALLSYWAERADVVKAKYRCEKLRDGCVVQRDYEAEEQRLRCAIAKGRERYIAAEDELRHWELEMRKVKGLLEKRTTLDEMNRALHQMADEGKLRKKGPEHSTNR
uniref:SH3 domain-containing protein n=1 Tax=Trypanosoma congolense (strain IL3000) TaxID=1068625 RepID=G0V0Q3_TRYCI|nr:conserved hypothetical protein [Trypanosoma congolense IL3000]